MSLSFNSLEFTVLISQMGKQTCLPSQAAKPILPHVVWPRNLRKASTNPSLLRLSFLVSFHFGTTLTTLTMWLPAGDVVRPSPCPEPKLQWPLCASVVAFQQVTPSSTLLSSGSLPRRIFVFTSCSLQWVELSSGHLSYVPWIGVSFSLTVLIFLSIIDALAMHSSTATLNFLTHLSYLVALLLQIRVGTGSSGHYTLNAILS